MNLEFLTSPEFWANYAKLMVIGMIANIAILAVFLYGWQMKLVTKKNKQ